MIQRNARRWTRSAACALPLYASVGCSLYDPSLLKAGTLDHGGNGGTSQSGASGTTDDASAGIGNGGYDTEPAGGGGSTGASTGGLMGAGGAVDRGGAGGSFGTGGSSGLGGTAGSGGASTGGTPGNGGGAAGGGGSGGALGVAGTGGSGATASGCAKLTVPLDDAADKAHFVISLASPADLSQATVSMHIYVRAGSGGSIFNYVQDSGTYRFFSVAPAQRAALTSFSGWSTVTWAVGAQPDSGSTGIVKTSIKNIGIEVGAQPSSSWTNPTIIYLDSITVTTPTLSFTFDAASAVSPTATTTAATGQALWLNGGATDTTAAGVTLGWQATCP